ncbi:phosphoribosyl-dephospho-CoA transferase [Pseudoxanthobacter soli DSM 19599]|uniref:Phosphoribosyl-dephospho-CoA transferase n=1 Tax=Pseudoxanthobacter soli DSM 19599 TaxID=1123029 RepID=A0A1M7Z7E4_9HYPH|nr:malonate decarboxylase holo-[acyl-carrier-protein] synthase [Pseudoxanthobacter soli]SHO60863.1 phosphoribosyl-dephospho-CoA transferase [Pseudoxanthobacter soli DSM 19599]
MISPSSRGDRPIRRHDLVFVSPEGWRTLTTVPRDLEDERLVSLWADSDWPLVTRRPMPGDGDGDGIALGLPSPPSTGKRRLALVVPPAEVVSVTPPPALHDAAAAAPAEWQPVLERIEGLAKRHGVTARVFGSLAWQSLTGQSYLTGNSDIDLLFVAEQGANLHGLAADLAVAEADAPMRLDGEFVRADGAAVNWREFHDGAGDLLVKTLHGVSLLRADLFWPGAPTS